MNETTLKKIVITGASRGLGLELARQALAHGYAVVGIGRSAVENTPELAGVLAENPDTFSYYEFDLGKTADIYQLCRQIIQEQKRIYGLVNNAATGGDGVLATMHETDIQHLLALNVTAPIYLCKYFGRHMMRHGQGRIVNVSSVVAQTGYSGLSVYAASKGAMNSFTKSLARELGKRNVIVNAVAPGFMETEMTAVLQEGAMDQIRRRSPLKRFPTLEEVAATTLLLLDANNQGLCGEIITVDAGNTC